MKLSQMKLVSKPVKKEESLVIVDPSRFTEAERRFLPLWARPVGSTIIVVDEVGRAHRQFVNPGNHLGAVED